MKKYLFLSIVFSALFTFHSDAQHGDAQHATSVGGNAQRGNAQRVSLKGPAAKNHKPWKNSESATTILVTQRNERKGPAAKNNKVRKENMKMNPVVFESREELKGPKAKNFSPGHNINQVACRGKKKCLITNFALFNSL